MIRKLALCLICACGAAEGEEPAAPKPAKTAEPTEPAPVQSAEPATSGADDPLHAALVDAHKKAVETCFGGFGKGAPYSATLTISSGTVSEAKVEALGEGHGPLPASCIEKSFRGTQVPGDASEVHARFAVAADSCSVPQCAETDLVCTFKRDIACSVVIDSR